MMLKDIFFNRHLELRTGWRILIYLCLLIVFSMAFLAPVYFLGRSQRLLPLVALVAATGVSSFIMTRFIHHKPFTALGLAVHESALRELTTGVLLGFLMMSAIFIVELALGDISLTWRGLGLSEIGLWLGLAAVEFILVALMEELLFRGYFFQALIQGVTLLPATFIVAVLFSAAHRNNPNVEWIAYLNIGVVSIMFSLAYFRTRGLWAPIGLHFSWNFTQTAVYAFPTSGLSYNDSKLFSLVQTGPAWFTGGEFGPEGGLLATCVIFAGLWYTLKTRRLAGREGIVTLDSIEDLVLPPVPEGEKTR